MSGLALSQHPPWITGSQPSSLRRSMALFALRISRAKKAGEVRDQFRHHNSTTMTLKSFDISVLRGDSGNLYDRINQLGCLGVQIFGKPIRRFAVAPQVFAFQFHQAYPKAEHWLKIDFAALPVLVRRSRSSRISTRTLLIFCTWIEIFSR